MEENFLRRIEHLIRPEEEGRMVKSIARNEMQLSYTQFTRLKFSGGIFLDEKNVHADVRVHAGQILSAVLTDTGAEMIPHDVPFSIAYEDEDYFIIDKPAPLPTLCSVHQEGPTLENGLYAYLSCPKDYVFRPVNRLDKGTSGLMAVARNAHAQQLLQKRLHTPAFIREYEALCLGHLPEKEGIIALPIGKTGPGSKREICPDGKEAVTHYRVEEEKNGLSLVRLRLETGRTHQIRVHLSALSCPILGDYLYGTPHDALPGRFALHACLLSFQHPISGREICVQSALPEEIRRLLN